MRKLAALLAILWWLGSVVVFGGSNGLRVRGYDSYWQAQDEWHSSTSEVPVYKTPSPYDYPDFYNRIEETQKRTIDYNRRLRRLWQKEQNDADRDWLIYEQERLRIEDELQQK